MIEKTVITVNNEAVPLSQTRVFEGKYYKIGNPCVENSGDCYLINGKYFRVEKGSIVFEHLLKQYVIKNVNIIHGLVDNNQLGYFYHTSDVIIVTDEHGNELPALNESIVLQNKMYREEISTGRYFHISQKSTYQFLNIKKPSQEYKTSLPYDSKGLLSGYVQKYENQFKSKVLFHQELFGKALKDYTFGFEFETIKGFIPSRITDKLGVIPLRDGSISGIEYVTIPLQGTKGVQTLYETVKVLDTRTTYNNTCALHLHIGNIPRTKEFILAFFKLTAYIQDDIFQMFPLYKKYNFKIKNKNYSKPYPIYDLISKMDTTIDDKNINKNFNILFQYLTDGVSFDEYDNDLNCVNAHPSDPSGNQKWNIKKRYHVHNLIPLIFGNKSTIEFRIHTPTYDMTKISMFLLLNTVLIDYVKIKESSILKNNDLNTNYDSDKLISIVKEYCELTNTRYRQSVYNNLVNYISDRKSKIEILNKHLGVIYDESECSGYNINWNKDIPEETVITDTNLGVIDPYTMSVFDQLISLNNEVI
jgi:hypothetical protein